MKKEFPSPQELMLKREFPGNNKQTLIDSMRKEQDPDYLPVSSCTDCTGLIPSAPQTEEELDSYNQIQPFLPKTN